jgi:NodT family efflux transporter outer membrane factor (OMF) lipoprotein
MLLLTACVAGPDFRPPEIPGTGASEVLPAPMPELPEWWKAFEWPALDELMREALAGNRDLTAAQARYAESLASAGAVAGEAQPQFGVDGGSGRQKYGFQFLGPEKVPAFHYWSVTATATWFLDYMGAERRATEREQAFAAYRQQQIASTYLTVTGNILVQAIASASARSQIAAAEAILERDARLVALVQEAQAAGEGTRMDVLNAQRQLANDRTLLPPLRKSLAQAEHALAALVGRDSSWTAPAFELDAPHLPVIDSTLPSEWLRTRPDVAAAEAQLHAATAAVGMATADLYPRIRLGASFGPQSDALSDLFDEDSLASSLVAGITAPIFDGGTLRARRDAAQAAMRATLAQYEQTVLQSCAQVASLLDAVRHDAELIDAQRAAGEVAAERLALARENHRAGNAGVLPVLDAELTGLLARLGHARALAQRQEDMAQLILALGGGLPPPEHSAQAD